MQQATHLARQMVTRWGMSDKVGPVSLGGRENSNLAGDQVTLGGAKPYSETFATLIDTEVQRILQETYAEAMRLLREHRTALEAVAEALVEHETLDEQQVLSVSGIARAPRSPVGPQLALAGAGAQH